MEKLKQQWIRFRINQKHKKAYRYKKNQWLEWANLMSKDPAILDIVSAKIIKPGVMASDLVKLFAKSDSTGLKAWIEQMELEFFRHMNIQINKGSEYSDESELKAAIFLTDDGRNYPKGWKGEGNI